MMQRKILLSHNFTAGGTLTEGLITKFGSDDDTVVAAAAATDALMGVALADASSGDRVDVQIQGVAWVKLGGTVTRGDDVTSDGAGKGVSLSAAATIKGSIGRAMASGVNGDIIPVKLEMWNAVTA